MPARQWAMAASTQRSTRTKHASSAARMPGAPGGPGRGGGRAREAGASVVYGGIHATLYPNEARELGGAHAVVTGDGDHVWAQVLADAASGTLRPYYHGMR